MIRLLSLHLILGIICLKLQDISGDDRDVSPAVLCRNPQVVSATQTPYGVICLIPKPVESAPIEKRQQFVRSLPKLMKSEQNDNLQVKLVPNLKAIQDQFLPQSNILSKRSILSNWFQKFYESLYHTVYKSLKKAVFRNVQSDQQQHNQQQGLPQENPRHLPLVSPDQLRTEGQTFFPISAQNPNHIPFPAQESQLFTNFVPSMSPKPDQLLAPEFPQSFMPSTPDMNLDMNSDSLPLLAYNNEDVHDNEPVIDETRLGPAVHDLPQYNYGSVRQLATYLQSIQSKINRQKFRNYDDEKQSEGSESINDYSSLTADSSNDKHEFIIPLYTDVKVKEKQFSTSEGRSSDEVRRPRKLVYEFHGYKRDMDCKGKFKPLKSDTEREQPSDVKTAPSMQDSGKSRRKRYIELDYSQMQLRKLPIWFRNDEEGPVPEAIVEVKPRSLFRWEQPMLGWKPIVPPEDLRKDLFLKRNGDPLHNWDHEQVESQTSYLWFKPDLNSNQTNDKAIKSPYELNDADNLTIESLKNLGLSKSSVIVDRRSARSKDFTPRDYFETNDQHFYDKNDNNRYVLSNERPADNQVVESDSGPPTKEPDVTQGIKAVEVENVGEDITQIKSLEEIAALPGAVIKPIDQKLTDILLKVLSHNSDFAQKRITNAYFLEFPKLPKYVPSAVRRPLHKQITEQNNFYKHIQIPVEIVPAETPGESSITPHYDIDYDKDIKLTDSDYEYGEMLCANKMTGAVADVRKGCRIYFQCTPYTIDTYVCPRGSIFDNRKQFCLPYNEVICGTYS